MDFIYFHIKHLVIKSALMMFLILILIHDKHINIICLLIQFFLTIENYYFDLLSSYIQNKNIIC